MDTHLSNKITDATVLATKNTLPQGSSYFALGEAAYAQKSYDVALEYFSQETRVNPSWIRSWMGMGTILLAQGRFDECRRHMIRALRAIPNSPILHMFLGDCYLNLDEFELAINEYQTAITLLARYGTSIEQVAINHDAIQAQIHKAIGNCLMMIEEDTRAIEHYLQAIAHGETSLDLKQKLALIYIETSHYQEAEDLLQQALEQTPDAVHTHQLMGYLAGCQRMQGGLDEAMAQIQRYEQQVDIAENLIFRLSRRTAQMAREFNLVQSDDVTSAGKIVKNSQKEFQKALRSIGSQTQTPDEMDNLADDLMQRLLPHFKTHSQVLQEIEGSARDIVGIYWDRLASESRELLLQALYLESKYEKANFSTGLTGIQYCFVLEKELKAHLFYPFKEQYGDVDTKYEKFKIMANFMTGKINLSLGQMANVLEALKESNPHELMGSMEAFRKFIIQRFKSGLALINSDFPEKVNELAINYRNCWAHGENLRPEASAECRLIVLGGNGTMGLLATFLEELRESDAGASL
ncbi:tetratricopeptide repeat protein [Chrysiogenes arsenatis]|uniref:tetratricopeptide repeat protein n=1 Tax=Chrysiogenes arsenatis TaxID=309797 RepID=UPI0004232F92|nr:tetratricopeptide repeat protein [Chrysiogenes arsenatis]